MDDIDHFLAHIHFIGDDDFLFAVPLDTPEELRARMFAAWKSFGKGLLSIDEVLENNRASWQFDREDRTELQVFVDDIVLACREHAYLALNSWASPDTHFKTMGQFAAGAALMRLHSSFTTLALLARFGFGFEAASVSRLILEQIAWVYAVRNHVDRSLLGVSPTHSITGLRTLIPWAGHLYGTLSDYAHIDPELGNEYVSRRGDLSIVLLRRPQFWSPRLAWVYALLSDMYVILTEVIFPNDKSVAVQMNNDDVRLLPDRVTAKLVKQASQYALFDMDTFS
jgi:hypothetical protein